MNHNILIEKADNALRKLKPGFGWQTYKVYAIRTVSKNEFYKIFEGKQRTMEEAQTKWENEIVAFVNRRAAELGMQVAGIKGQLVEQPLESSMVETLVWEQKDLIFVWSIWAFLRGPVQQEVITSEPLPLFMFWPSDVYRWSHGVPEIMDATKLSKREQGLEL